MVGHFQEFEDEYLETMYEFHETEPLGIVRTGDLATRLGVTPASATEMVQRLASRGLLNYIPYKGARLTKEGLIHGRKMKRRHRLAEVLLDQLPYEGDAHETACRLEHAIDDDMEVALSRLVGPDAKDPSGRPIPAPTEDIALRLSQPSPSVTAHAMSQGAQGNVVGLLLPADACALLAERGFGLGTVVTRRDSGLAMENGYEVHLPDDWLQGVFVTLVENPA